MPDSPTSYNRVLVPLPPRDGDPARSPDSGRSSAPNRVFLKYERVLNHTRCAISSARRGDAAGARRRGPKDIGLISKSPESKSSLVGNFDRTTQVWMSTVGSCVSRDLVVFVGICGRSDDDLFPERQ